MKVELTDSERTLLHRALLNYNLKRDLTEKEKEEIKDLIVKIYK